VNEQQLLADLEADERAAAAAAAAAHLQGRLVTIPGECTAQGCLKEGQDAGRVCLGGLCCWTVQASAEKRGWRGARCHAFLRVMHSLACRHSCYVLKVCIHPARALL
jgi:hypothetical protein